jgi:hypothetical protein
MDATSREISKRYRRGFGETVSPVQPHYLTADLWRRLETLSLLLQLLFSNLSCSSSIIHRTIIRLSQKCSSATSTKPPSLDPFASFLTVVSSPSQGPLVLFVSRHHSSACRSSPASPSFGLSVSSHCDLFQLYFLEPNHRRSFYSIITVPFSLCGYLTSL